MTPRRDRQRNDEHRWFVLHVVIFLIVLLPALYRFAPSPPKGRDCDANTFSAGRVRDLLRRITHPGVSHPHGTVDHARVRDAVVEEFRGLGLEAEIHEGFAFNEHLENAVVRNCAEVQNIVVRLKGSEGKHAILLAAHYDSVPAGPGVADDGSGVCAILEIARILASGPAPRNDIVFLISDAEELGMIGATAFAADHPLMSKIGVVLNWEARGTRGPSFMFETGPNNLGLIRLMTRDCRRSFSSSLFPAVYELLPNDSDLSVFKNHEIPGMNFAFVGGVQHYHTPLDNLDNLDPGSVQHQGEHFLAMTRALSQAPLDELPKADAIYFDILGWVTLWWPQPWNPGFAFAVAAMALLVAVITVRQSGEPPSRALLALIGWPLVIVTAAILGEAACWIVTACSANFSPWPASPQPMCVALWCGGIAVPLAAWRWMGRRVSAAVLSAVMTACWAGIGLALAWCLPGASYLFIVPAAVACLLRLIGLSLGSRWQWPNLAFLAAACLLWLPTARGLVDALGLAHGASQTVPLALLGFLIAPTTSATSPRYRSLALIAVVGSIALVVAIVVPPYSAEWPQPVSIAYYEDVDAGEAFLEAHAGRGRIPDSIREHLSSPGRSSLPPLSHREPSDVVSHSTDAAKLTAPTLEVQATHPVANGRRRLELLLTPGPQQRRVMMVLGSPDAVTDATANGCPIKDPSIPLVFNFSDDTQVEIELTVAGKLELTLAGISYELPAGARSLHDTRPASAVPIGIGDHSVVIKRLEL